MRIAGVDLGYDSIKVITSHQNEPIVIPNIVAPGYERMVLQEEDSPLQALDVTINSHALSRNGERYFVGWLAAEHEDNIELEETENKALSDQALIVALTALAYIGISNPSSTHPSFGQPDKIDYIVGTGLPVRTYARYHPQLIERLVGEHEVTFLSTPGLKNRTVRVHISRAFVSIEGAAAIFNLATHDNLQIRDETLYNGCIGVCEIGAITTDFPILRRMAVDNLFSSGEYLGLSSYLDSIITEVEDTYGYSFPSRAKLVQRIKANDYNIQLLGEGEANIKPIVDYHFNRIARRIFDLIKKRWKKCPDIEAFYVVGGGASALRPYLLQHAGSVKLRFVEESEFQNVRGYLKIAKQKVNFNPVP